MLNFAARPEVPYHPLMSTPPVLMPVKTAELPAPVGPYSPAVIAGNLVFVSGQAGRDPKTGQLAADVEGQTEQTLKNVAAILEAAGSGLDHVVKATVYVADLAHWPAFNAIYGETFGAHRPARTVVPVATLHYGYLVEMDVIAALKDPTGS